MMHLWLAYTCYVDQAGLALKIPACFCECCDTATLLGPLFLFHIFLGDLIYLGFYFNSPPLLTLNLMLKQNLSDLAGIPSLATPTVCLKHPPCWRQKLQQRRNKVKDHLKPVLMERGGASLFTQYIIFKLSLVYTNMNNRPRHRLFGNWTSVILNLLSTVIL